MQALCDYAERHEQDLPPALYARKEVRFIIDLDRSGNLLNPRPADTTDEDGTVLAFDVPDFNRGNQYRAYLMADDAEFTFGKVVITEKRARRRHQVHLDALARCVDETGDDGATAVLAFLENDPLSQLQLPDQFGIKDLFAFRVDGRLCTDSRAVQRFWVQEASELGEVMQCLVCREQATTVRIMPVQVKGVRGGGKALVSFNKEAFCSYGREQTLNSPICLDCAVQSMQGLNHLLASDGNHLYLGDETFVIWAQEPDEDLLIPNLLEMKAPGGDSEARALMESVYAPSKFDPYLDPTAFYALVLSSYSNRIVVRRWISSTVGDMKQKLARWLAAQRVVDTENGKEGRLLSLTRLARATTLPERDVPEMVPRQLLRSALIGVRLPQSILRMTLIRNKAERGVTHERAALIRLFMVFNGYIKENEMVGLDPENNDPGYLCGRLLALLEKLQHAALGKVGTTVADRYYGSASTTPMRVFPGLMRTAQAHLSKLRANHGGLAAWYEHQRGEIMDLLEADEGFPRRLTAEQQALFALGFCHQWAWFNKKKEGKGES